MIGEPCLNARVLIVDDHELIRQGLRMLIGREPDMETCGETGEEAEAMRLVQQCRPDVAIVDLTLSSGNGLNLVTWIHEQQPECKIVVSTMHDEHLYGERVLRAGASGFVNKQLSASVVIEAIRRVLKNKLYFSEKLIRRVMNQALTHPQQIGRTPVETLSNRELEVFRLIGQGLSTSQVAEQTRLALSTIETYRERIKHKLGLETAADLAYHAIHWACDAGLSSRSIP